MASASRVLLAATLILHFTTITETTSLHADDLDTIRARVTAPYLAPPNAKSVTNWIESMQQDGTWTDIEYDNKGRSAWAVPAHLSRVTCLARAYCTPKSTLHDDPEVLAAALKGLDAWLRLDPQNPNWWWNQIGAPKSLLPIMLLLDDELSEAQREGGLKFLRRAQISMTGQNLVWVTEITAGRGLLENDADLVAKAYSRIADEIRVGTSEGIQPDFSFHQHGPCLYSHGYGASFIVDCARIAVRVDGTTMAFPNEKIELLSHLILDGTQWMIRGTGTDFGAEETGDCTEGTINPPPRRGRQLHARTRHWTRGRVPRLGRTGRRRNKRPAPRRQPPFLASRLHDPSSTRLLCLRPNAFQTPREYRRTSQQRGPSQPPPRRRLLRADANRTRVP